MMPHELARKAHEVETVLLKQQSGIQDQICSAYGGVSYIEMDNYPHSMVTRVPISQGTREALDALGISDLADLRWSALDPSKQRRVLLARSWAANPDMLLLDETFHGLAPEDEAAMRSALERMMPRVPVLVWVTHNEASAPRWLDRRLALEARRPDAAPGA